MHTAAKQCLPIWKSWVPKAWTGFLQQKSVLTSPSSNFLSVFCVMWLTLQKTSLMGTCIWFFLRRCKASYISQLTAACWKLSNVQAWGHFELWLCPLRFGFICRWQLRRFAAFIRMTKAVLRCCAQTLLLLHMDVKTCISPLWCYFFCHFAIHSSLQRTLDS